MLDQKLSISRQISLRSRSCDGVKAPLLTRGRRRGRAQT